MILATFVGLASVGTSNAAYLDKNDEGIYVVYNAEKQQVLNVGLRLKQLNKYWEIEATSDGQQWVKLNSADGKVAKFTNTSRKTLARLFAEHPNKELVKRITTNDNLETDCIDSGEDMFCRFKVSERKLIMDGVKNKMVKFNFLT